MCLLPFTVISNSVEEEFGGHPQAFAQGIRPCEPRSHRYSLLFKGTQGDDAIEMVYRFPIAQKEYVIHPRFTKIRRDCCFKENSVIGFGKLIR